MIKKILFLSPFLFLYAFVVPTHDEMIGHFQFESCNKQLCVDIHLEKLNLAGALMIEKDCQPSTMLKVCGNEYLQENFSIAINGQQQQLELLEIKVEQQFIVYRYTTPIFAKNIQQLAIENTYLNQFNEHGFSRLKFVLNDQVRHFKMSKARQAINVVY